MTRCSYCNQPAWYQDRSTGDLLCPAHGRLEVRGPLDAGRRPEACALTIRPSSPDDKVAILESWSHFWNDNEMHCFGRNYQAADLPALLACDGDQVVGVLSYAIEREWEAINMVVLHVLPGHQGQGGAAGLIAALEDEAGRLGIGRLIVATSNDNPLALYFYQRLGFQITSVQVNTIEPDPSGEPFVGIGGLAVRDEIQLEKQV